MANPVVLIIRDGWGDNPGGREQAEANGDATLLAKTPFHDKLCKKYPVSHVSGSGLDVGLPEGQMGNSEVGHLNLGAGRIIYQDLTRINNTIEHGKLGSIEILQDAFGKTMSDPAFLAWSKKSGRPIAPIVGKGVEDQIKNIQRVYTKFKEALK